MIRLLVLFCALNFASGPVRAQSEFSLPSPTNYQAEFKQVKTLPFLTQKFTSTGTLTYHQTRGILWETKSPVQQTLLLSPKGAFYITEEQGRRVYKPQGTPMLSQSLLQLFKGDMEALTANFTAHMTQKDAERRLTLLPKNQTLQKAVKKIEIWAGAKGQVRKIEIQEAKGSVRQIQFFRSVTLDPFPPGLLEIYEPK